MRLWRTVPRSTPLIRFVWMTILALTVVAVVLPDPARAASIDVDAPAESAIGDTVVLIATITDEGVPITGADVAVTRLAAIGGETGFVVLDRGVTDEFGVVEFEFVQYADSSQIARMRIEYEGPDGIEATEFEMTVQPGPQQHTSVAGLDIGFVNVGWLLAVLALVWAILLFAVYQLVAVSRANDGARQPFSVAPYAMVLFVMLTASGMFIVIATQPTTHANLSPNESFERAPGAVVGEEYDYLGYSSDDTPRPDDLSGEVLYVQSGCAGCHGPGGSGAVVGGELSNSVLADTEEFVVAIRRGPKGMPGYREEILSDAEIDRMIEYILSDSRD